MSLTDTFVYCTNDKFLGTKHNTILFPDGFLCFDDDDAPEAVVRIGPLTDTVQKAREYVAEQLTKLKVPFQGKIRYHNTCGRCFEDNIVKSNQAHSFWVHVCGPIPVEVYPETVQYSDNWRGCLEHTTIPKNHLPEVRGRHAL